MADVMLIAVVDTCCLFPLTLRDLLLRAAEAGLFRLRWSEQILEELRDNLRRDRGLTEDQARHLLTEMRRAFPEATVTGYEQLVGSMTNDQGDRHVLATAVHAGAEVIVTSNVGDFPKDSLAPYDIEVQTPDEFLQYLYDLFPDQMVDALIQLNADRQSPPETLHKTLERLAKSARSFTAMISQHERVKLLLTREEEQVSSSGHRGSPGES